MTGAVRATGLHLDEDNGSPVDGHQVQITASPAVTPRDDFIPPASQESACGAFAPHVERLRLEQGGSQIAQSAVPRHSAGLTRLALWRKLIGIAGGDFAPG
jgi:hypothetical protein